MNDKSALTMTIPQMEEQFNNTIRQYGILWYDNYGCTINGINHIIMGNHITMCYPKNKKLSRNEIKILTALVEKYYHPVVYIRNNTKANVTYGSMTEPVHEIIFVFETVKAARQREKEENRQ